MKRFNLEEYLKNPSRKVVTRNGRNVKIHCTNYHLPNQCVIAEVEGTGSSFSFNQCGQPYGYAEENPLDLFFAPEKHEGWINVYRNGEYLWCGDIKRTEAEAKEFEDSKFYITSIKIEWEE